MCVIFWTTTDPNYDLVIASNRDEFLSRPTLSACWHSFTSSSYQDRILSARDSTGGGTWLGITRNGAFATLTNFTENSAPLPAGMEVFESRGKLVRDWLVSSSTDTGGRKGVKEVEKQVKGYLEGLRGKLDRYPGFNLLVGSISDEGTVVAYITNRNPDGSLNTDREAHIFLPPSLFPTSQKEGEGRGEVPRGMSNSVLSEPWTKVTSGSIAFRSALSHHSSTKGEDALVETLFDLLWTSSTPAPTQRSELRNSVLISPLELPTAGTGEGGRDWYATRTSTVILIGKDGRARFVERDTFGIQQGKAVLLNGPEGSGAMRGRKGGERDYQWSIS